MSIIKAGKILINGSTNAFGGYVYSATFNHEYGNTPSSVSISIISKSKQYLPVKLSALVPYTISFGDELALKMYAVSSNIEDGTGGKILKVDFIDGRFKMNRYWVTLSDFPCKSPNIIKVGSKYIPASSQLQPPQAPPNNSPALQISLPPLVQSTDGSQSFFSYSYAELVKRSPIALPNIPNQTPVYRLNTEGMLGDIFSQFCRAYGFNWYWDYDNDVPILLDLRTDVDLDITLPDQLRGISCLKNLNIGESIRDLEAQGAVFFNNIESANTQSSTWSVVQVLNIFNQSDFFGFPIFDRKNLDCAIMAVYGEDVYETYLFNKYDFNEAISIQGFDPMEDLVNTEKYDANNRGDTLNITKLNDVGGLTQTQLDTLHQQLFSQFGLPVPDTFDTSIRVIHARPRGDIHNSVKDAHFRMADILKAGNIGWFTSPFSVSSPDFQLTQVDPKTILSQVPGIGTFLINPNNSDKTFNLTNIDKSTNPTKVQDLISENLFIVTFPKLKFLFDSFGTINPNNATINTTLSPDIRLQARLLTDGHQLFPNALPNDVHFVIWGYRVNPPSPSVEGLEGYIGLNTPTLGDGSYANLSDSFPSKYKNVLCGIPVLNDLVTSFKIVTLTNESVTLPKAAVFNTTVLPTKTAKTFSVDVYGINTGLNLHPNKGLDSFRITMGEDGYESSYTLSSKKRIPLDNLIARAIHL